MSNLKILIVEDEPIVSMEIERTIKKLGYEVSNVVGNYKDAIQSVKRNKPHLILMDINLDSEKDGIETVQEIKNTHNIPVIYLTADSDPITIQRAIKTDPVGYLSKPFKREDLSSTISLGLYKSQGNQKVKIDNNLIDISEGFFYDLKCELLYYGQQPIKLSVKEKILLTKLVQAQGQIVTFRELECLIWNEAVTENTLRNLVYRLRGKLDHKLIETIPTFGLKLENIKV